MVLIVVEISKEEFDFLSCSSFSHFENGVIFEDGSHNVMAFEKIDFGDDNLISYWKVIEKDKEVFMSENDVKKTNIITVIINCVITVLSIILKAITG